MSLQTAVQQHRAESEPLDWAEYCKGHDAPYVHILGEGANRSRRRISWFSWFAAATFLLAVMEILLWP